MRIQTKKIALAGMFLALAYLLPYLTGNLPQMGTAFSPMHFPVLLCGFVCGWPYGLAVGFIAPILRFFINGMPPYPTFMFMALELAVYGFTTGIFYKILPKKNIFIFISLIIAMLSGRAFMAIFKFAFLGLTNTVFTFNMFLNAYFIETIPGIVLQIILVPIIIMALKKAKLIPIERTV